MQPQFLVIGHTVQDLLSEDDPASWRLGGASSFASILARNLGLRAAVLTSAGPDIPLDELLPDIEMKVVPSRRTTQIRNVYGEGPRRQFVPQRATLLSAEHVPPEWRRVPIVLLGPVIGEVDESVAACFNGSLLGIGAQGWLRRAGRDTRVRPVMPADFHVHGMLRNARALFLSDEDIPPGEAPPPSLTGRTLCRLSVSRAATAARTSACGATGAISTPSRHTLWSILPARAISLPPPS